MPLKRLLFSLLLLSAPAHAATYWVSPAGVGGRSGADSTANSTTLAWFNSNAVAGDVCRFKSGTYASPIAPAHDGTSGSRIRYYGFPQDPAAITVADIQFGYAHGSFCTAKWFNLSAGMTGCFAAANIYTTNDSIVNCISTAGGGGLNIMGKACVFDSLRISGTINGTGQTHWISLFIPGSPAGWFSTSNLISNCTFSPTVNTTSGQGDVHIIGLMHTTQNTFYRNTFNVNVLACAGYFFGVEQYESYYNVFQENTWNITMNGAVVGSRGVWCHRDSSSYNRYVGNNVNITGSGGDLSFMLSNSGSFALTTGHNFYGGNTIKDHSPQPGTGVFWFYDGSRQDTVQFNNIVTDVAVPCINIPSGRAINGSVFRHNTYWTAGPTAMDVGQAVASNGARLTSEIFYCRTANAAGSENVKVPSGMGLDSAGVFFSLGSASPGRAIAYGGVDGQPGTGGNFGLATRSVWGSPRFADSSYASFDGRVADPGVAAGSNWTDGYAGAGPFAGAGGDVTPPAVVSNLAASNIATQSLLLSWNAPGDDGLVGLASAYDLRFSTSPITGASFSGATALSPQPVPLTAGTLQNYVVNGLLAGTSYYFAIRTRDEMNNWSAVSNVINASTLAGDTTPPAAIGDLGAGP